jgi:hypothetical protein
MMKSMVPYMATVDRKWIRDFIREEKPTWATLKKHFMQHFSNHHVAEEYSEKIRKFTQEKDEKIQQYADRFRKILANSGMREGETTTIRHFVAGLRRSPMRDSLALVLALNLIVATSVTQIANLAASLEGIYELMASQGGVQEQRKETAKLGDKKLDKKLDNKQFKLCSNCWRNNHWVEECRSQKREKPRHIEDKDLQMLKNRDRSDRPSNSQSNHRPNGGPSGQQKEVRTKRMGKEPATEKDGAEERDAENDDDDKYTESTHNFFKTGYLNEQF